MPVLLVFILILMLYFIQLCLFFLKYSFFIISFDLLSHKCNIYNSLPFCSTLMIHFSVCFSSSVSLFRVNLTIYYYSLIYLYNHLNFLETLMSLRVFFCDGFHSYNIVYIYLYLFILLYYSLSFNINLNIVK